MAGSARALLQRVRLRPASTVRGTLKLELDGWPLVHVDLTRRAVRVNELRAGRVLVHTVHLPSCPTTGPFRAGAVVDELYLLTSGAAVFVTPDDAHAGHAHVQVVESHTARLLLDRNVRCGPRVHGPTALSAGTAAARE